MNKHKLGVEFVPWTRNEKLSLNGWTKSGKFDSLHPNLPYQSAKHLNSKKIKWITQIGVEFVPWTRKGKLASNVWTKSSKSNAIHPNLTYQRAKHLNSKKNKMNNKNWSRICTVNPQGIDCHGSRTPTRRRPVMAKVLCTVRSVKDKPKTKNKNPKGWQKKLIKYFVPLNRRRRAVARGTSAFVEGN